MKPFLSKKEAAEYLGVSKYRLDQLIKSKKIRPLVDKNPGTRALFYRKSLDKWMSR